MRIPSTVVLLHFQFQLLTSFKFAEIIRSRQYFKAIAEVHNISHLDFVSENPFLADGSVGKYLNQFRMVFVRLILIKRVIEISNLVEIKLKLLIETELVFAIQNLFSLFIF